MTVVSYIVSRDGAQVATSAATTYVDSGLSPATTYSYQVAAVDMAGNLSAESNSASVTTGAAPDTTPPSQPTGLTATAAGAVGANLSWTASTDNVGVTGYIVSRNGAQVATPAATSFSDTGLSPATTYTYTVVARDAAGNQSTPASISVTTGTPADTTPPSQPTGLTGSASGGTGATLSWTASTDNVGVTGYVVTRNGVQVATPAGTSFADSGLTPATTYSYTVAARDAAGNRSTASSVSVTTLDTLAPSKPAGLTGTASGSTGANLSWTASTDNVGVTGYIVTRNGVQVATPTTTSFADTGLAAATTYTYTVAARDAAGNKSTAASVNVTTGGTPPDTTAPTQPTGFTAAAASSILVNLSWSASTDNVGVTGYIVTRNGAQIATPTATTLADTGLAPSTTYTYTVVARDAAGNMSTAASATVTTPAPPPANGTANLGWDAVTAPNLTGYRVYYGTGSGNYIQAVGQGLASTTTTFTVSGLTSGTRYFFAVTATDSLGNESPFSNEVFKDIP
jgi:chitodextrinase